MRGKVMKNRHIIECSCGDSEHLLVIDSHDNEPNWYYITLTSKYVPSVWLRLKLAVRYLSGDTQLSYDTVLISERNVSELEQLVNDIKAEKN